ncbi:hypothetical protein [Roseibium sp.]|uniref:hypothetical protein n=1 Tax=Roseibium sp. TaxID=1936156 RepID=UPI003D0A14E3
MSVHYLPDLSARADLPDFEVPLPTQPVVGGFHRFRQFVVASGLFLGATFAIAVVFFLPVLAFNLSRIEALEIAGQQISVSGFVDQLGALFWGTFILALAFTSFIVRVLRHAPGRIIRPRSRPAASGDALPHLTVLRLSGHER